MLTSHARFSNLIARPPTPPRTVNEDIADALDFLDDHTRPEDAYFDTPPSNSPSSSAEPSSNNACKAAAKRVEFSPWTNYYKAPAFDRSRPSPATPLRSLLPSKELKSSRSILKAFARPVPVLRGGSKTNGCAASPYKFPSFAEMLESVVQQLAGELRSARQDAYIALTGTLNACDGTPDSDALRNKIGLIAQFIQRDMSATLPGAGTIDTPLGIQAVKLADALLWNPVYAEQFDDEFRSFLIDRSILLLQEPQVPKALVRHHMYLLAKQAFEPTIVTAERVDRIITGLSDINERVSGNGVIGLRMAIYNKCLSQAQPTMVARNPDWLPHVFHGMLSSIKETRDRAIELGMHAGRSLGHISQVSRTVIELLDAAMDGEVKYVDLLETRLKAIVESKDKELRSHVPQIWTVVILFFRNKRRPLDRWPHFKQWLRVIQRCFNSSDLSVKHQANIAWNRLVCIIGPDLTTPKPIIKMLRQPLLTQLERKGTDGYAKRARQSAILSYNNLLYYALQPSAPSEQIDLYWNEYVVPVLSDAFLKGQKDIKSACEILAALIGNSPSRTWNEDRAYTAPADIEPAELPQLDPKWTRRRVDRVLELVSGCIAAANASDSDAEVYLRRVWSCLMSAIAVASSSEVRASMELKSAIAQIMNLLHRTWVEAVSSPSSIISPSAARFEFLATSAIESIGPIYFTDRILVRNGQSHFEAAATPSRRPDKFKGPLRSPLLHLVELLAKSSATNHVGSTSIFETARTLLASCSSARKSRQAKLELLQDCADHLGHECKQADSRYQVWRAVAECAESVISQNRKATEEPNTQHLGVEYRKVFGVLAVGFQGSYETCFAAGESLVKSLLQRVKAEAGDGAVVLAVALPFSEGAMKTWFSQENTTGLDNALAYGSLFLEMGLYHRSREVIEHGNKVLWGVTASSVKGPAFDPLVRTYEVSNRILRSAYENLDELPCDLLIRFMSALHTFLNRAPLSLSVLSLQRIQEGVATWVADSAERLGGSAAQFRELRAMVLDLWKGVLSRLGGLPVKDSALLMALQMLFSAGLRSRNRTILNVTVQFWNDSFGLQDTLEYPSEVELALRALRPFVELQLPRFPARSDDEYPENFPSFIESQNSFEDIPLRTRSEGVVDELPTGSEIARKAKNVSISETGDLPLGQSLSLPKHLHIRTPERRVRSTDKGQTSKARLRHEDSQVQFAAIESSPLNPQALDSQMLTDHQKEVRKRQHTEGCALFPDIFSSPVSKAPDRGDLVVPNGSNTSLDASDAGRHAALTEEANRTPLTPMDQDATVLDLISKTIASSPPEIPRENDLVPQARKHEAQEETGLCNQPCSEAGVSRPEDEFNQSMSSLASIIGKEHMNVEQVIQAHQHGDRQPNTAALLDEITAPVATAVVAEVTSTSGDYLLRDHRGHCEESMNRRVRVNFDKGLERQRESLLTTGPISAIPCLSPKPRMSLVQVNATNGACMSELNQHNVLGGAHLNASAESLQAQEWAVENTAIVCASSDSANQEPNHNEERPELYGSRGGGASIGLHEAARAYADRSDADQHRLDGDKVALEASIGLHQESEPEAPTSSPQTSRIDVFVDVPSSPLAEYPQVFVDASQTLMPISSYCLNDLEHPQLKSDDAPLEYAQSRQRTVHSTDGVNSRVEDSFLGEQWALPRDAEVDRLRVSGSDNEHYGSQTSIAESQATPRKTRKRKRSSWTTGKSAKKHKREVASTLPTVLNDISKVATRKEEDGDVGDYIVVATQPSQSTEISSHSSDPNSICRSKRTRAQPSNTTKPRLSQKVVSGAQSSRKRPLTPSTHQIREREVHATSRPLMDEAKSPKRRKTSRYSQEEAARAITAKKMSSAASPPVRVFSHVEIPVSTKHHTHGNVKQQPLQAMNLDYPSHPAQVHDLHDADLTTGVGYMIPSVEDTGKSLESGELGPDQEDSQVSQQVYAELEASLNTPVSSPRSGRETGSARASIGILARLKGILQDCKQMILGSSQEEREFDDVLFHLRRELHEAGRRGRTV